MSTENRIENVEKALASIQDHFDTEIKKEKRSRLIFAILAGVLSLLMLFAVLRVRGFITEYVTPRNLAQLLRSEVSRFLTPENLEKGMAELLPNIRTVVSKNLTENAPKVVVLVNVNIVDEMLPAIRQLAEDQLVQFADGAIQATAREMEDAATAVIREAKGRISDPERARELGDPAAVTAMLTGLVRLELAKRLTETPEEPLAVQLAASREQLRNINARLRGLATKKNLSRTEVLAKRLIQAWMGVIDGRIEGGGE